MVDDALTKGPSQKSLAMQKDLKNPNLTVNELVKRQTVDTSSLNQLIKKTEENIAFDKKYPPLVSTKAMLDNDPIDADMLVNMIVQQVYSPIKKNQLHLKMLCQQENITKFMSLTVQQYRS